MAVLTKEEKMFVIRNLLALNEADSGYASDRVYMSLLQLEKLKEKKVFPLTDEEKDDIMHLLKH